MAKPAYKSSRKDSRKSRSPRKAAGNTRAKSTLKDDDQTHSKKRQNSKPAVQEQIPPRVTRNGSRMPETTGMVLRAEPNKGYALIDSGNGEKLERYGANIIRRPEGQAIWLPTGSQEDWATANAVFTGNTDEEGQGRWHYPRGDLKETWPLAFDGLPYLGRFTSFRHTGVFPEQAVHWRPIRWICDDAVKFCAREKRRGNTYDVILLDPPAYGRGPKGEVWQLFEHLPYMLDLVRDLQSANPLLTILTSYAIRASHFALHELVQDIFAGFDGRLESGELVLQQELGGRSLSTSMFSRIISTGCDL